MQKTIKIGTNRGNPRLWLEGKCLSAMNWNTGDRFTAEFNTITNSITYTKHPEGKRKVAGGTGRPVIDTNTAKITETLSPNPRKTHAKVTITESTITFTPAEKPTSIKKLASKALVLAAFISAPFITQFQPHAKKVLIGCEESAHVRQAFEKLGHDVVSCDLLDTCDPTGWHIKDDILKYIDGDWDLGLFFPPCTFLTNSAAWAFNDPDYERYPTHGYHQKVKPSTLTGEARRMARTEAIEFFLALHHSNIPEVATENPVGAMSKAFRKPDQIIQPWEFGNPESKTTCLWLKNLNPLKPTQTLDIETHGYRTEKGTYRWQNQTPSGQSNTPPSKDRDIIRSKTYKGIAAAMATQWGQKTFF